MFGTQQCGVKAYTKVGIETGVDSASPHQLIVMLFGGALGALSAGLMHMKSGAIAEKGQSISKSILIIESGLRDAWNAIGAMPAVLAHATRSPSPGAPQP